MIVELYYEIVSLLYLDMDIYEPTKVALKELLPRMAKGSIIAFDEFQQINTDENDFLSLNILD